MSFNEPPDYAFGSDQITYLTEKQTIGRYIGIYLDSLLFIAVSKTVKTFDTKCICQGKVDTENNLALEALFGLVLNWAFIAQIGSWSLVIIVMNILVKKLGNILSGRQTEVEEQFFLNPTVNCLNYCIICWRSYS